MANEERSPDDEFDFKQAIDVRMIEAEMRGAADLDDLKEIDVVPVIVRYPFEIDAGRCLCIGCEFYGVRCRVPYSVLESVVVLNCAIRERGLSEWLE